MISLISKFIWAGACAPSIIDNIFFSLAILHISLTGKINAVGLVIWLKKITFVFFVIPSAKLFIKSSLDSRGNGIIFWIYLAPVFLQIYFQVLSNAPYSWLVVSISSPSFKSRLLITVFKAVDGFGEKTTSSLLQFI